MRADTFLHTASDGQAIFVYRWLPDEGAAVRGVVHIAHGLAEHAARYARLGAALVESGWAVYANDHRGHGRTAVRDEDLGYFAPSHGLRRVADDTRELVAAEQAAHPGAPVVLFGHSLGSFLAQLFLIDHGSLLRGAVLSATSGGRPGALAAVGRLVARFERWRQGERGRSALIDKLSFGSYNRRFAPTRTEFDWLSRDPAEVDQYVADPRCGFRSTNALWLDLIDEMYTIAEPANQARVPHDLPIYLFAGARDPVSDDGRGVEKLVTAYREAGLRDLTHRLYPDGRHEMLNETNRDEVTRDLVAWLAKIA
jgi:alpha-beta hydrolase superfamily lysophospholipase